MPVQNAGCFMHLLFTLQHRLVLTCLWSVIRTTHASQNAGCFMHLTTFHSRCVVLQHTHMLGALWCCLWSVIRTTHASQNAGCFMHLATFQTGINLFYNIDWYLSSGQHMPVRMLGALCTSQHSMPVRWQQCWVFMHLATFHSRCCETCSHYNIDWY